MSSQSKSPKPIFDKNELEEMAHDLLDTDFHSLSPRRQRILLKIAEGELVSEDPNKIFKDQLTFGQRLADSVAQWGGSWKFIIFTILCLFGWIWVNTALFFTQGQPLDPYPYIFLNLIISMVTAIQAPIIMMSQNRRAEKDRIDSNSNYETCLKIELELTRLHQRMDWLEEGVCYLSKDGDKKKPQ